MFVFFLWLALIRAQLSEVLGTCHWFPAGTCSPNIFWSQSRCSAVTMWPRALLSPLGQAVLVCTLSSLTGGRQLPWLCPEPQGKPSFHYQWLWTGSQGTSEAWLLSLPRRTGVMVKGKNLGFQNFPGTNMGTFKVWHMLAFSFFHKFGQLKCCSSLLALLLPKLY